jgi:hypothetical protein
LKNFKPLKPSDKKLWSPGSGNGIKRVFDMGNFEKAMKSFETALDKQNEQSFVDRLDPLDRFFTFSSIV